MVNTYINAALTQGSNHTQQTLASSIQMLAKWTTPACTLGLNLSSLYLKKKVTAVVWLSVKAT